jgi:hypothetical protein
MCRRTTVLGLGFGLLAAALSGCGDGLQYAEVEGTVTQGGKPLEKIQVEFHPDGTGPKSVGVTDAAGKYVLKSEGNGRDGAVVGSHRVVLRDMSIFPDKKLTREDLNKDLTGGKKSRIGALYGDSGKTPVKKSVAAGDKNTIDIEVK